MHGASVHVDSASELQDAINTAATASSPTTIKFHDEFFGNFVVPATNYPITIKGESPDAILNGNYAGTTLTVNVNAVVILKNITVTGGYNDRGGGIINDGNLTLYHCSIENNTATSLDGGGIINSEEAVLKINYSSIKENSAYLTGGGISNEGDLTIDKSKIENNSASIGSGGGIMNFYSINIEDSKIKGNTAQMDGGGINNIGTLNIDSTSIKDNTALTGNGGGINNESGELMITDSSIDKNEAVFGGGIANLGVGVLTLTDSKVKHNTATYGIGGGGGIYSNSSSAPVITNSKVDHNNPDDFAP